MLIELIGPSGTGKTTLLRGLSRTEVGQRTDFLSYEDYVLGQREAKHDKHGEEPPLLPVIRRHPELARLLWRVALAHGAPWKRRLRKASRCLLNFAIAEQLKRDYPHRLVVLDNGFTQTLWSLVVESRQLREHALIREALAYYHVAIGQKGIRLRVEDAAVIDRVFSRESGGRFNREAGAELRDAYGRWLQYFREIDALTPPGMIVAEIDASRPPEAVCAELAAVIQDIDVNDD